MKIIIIKYNAGNIRSVQFALERVGVTGILSNNPAEIQSADKVIFPGVGEASTAMSYLKEKNLDKIIVSLRQPVLGICLGMQLLCKHSEEGNTDCLGIFDLNVRKFKSPTPQGRRSAEGLKVPQIGWNNIYDLKSPLFKGISENSFMYFVHSYYVEKGTDSIAGTNYILEYSSAMQKDNFYTVQFHPEKSGETGQKILENFITL